METLELDVEVAKNQMTFDFDSIVDEEKEESSVFTNTLIKSVNHEYIANEVLFVVVKAYNEELVKNLPCHILCGKKMIDWVLMAGNGCEQRVVDDCEDIVERIKNINTDKNYIAVFYSDTPLFDKCAFNKVMDYFSSNGMNFLKLSRGFIAKTEYLKNLNLIYQSTTGAYEEKALLQVNTAKKINIVSSLLYNKILNYHINNGVIIHGQNSVFIDADVEIESGVVIYPNNVIEGQSVIASGAVLQCGNIIKDSIISNNSVVSASYIERSKIGQGVTVAPFSKILNEEV